jgi:hypothetical protein
MAHYAILDDNNYVTKVLTGPDEVNDDHIDFEDEFGKIFNARCKRTSYHTYGNQHKNGGTPFRGNYAWIGFKYDDAKNAFITPQPYPSWVLNQETFLWEAPTPQPNTTNLWGWFEPNQEWIMIAE